MGSAILAVGARARLDQTDLARVSALLATRFPPVTAPMEGLPAGFLDEEIEGFPQEANPPSPGGLRAARFNNVMHKEPPHG